MIKCSALSITRGGRTLIHEFSYEFSAGIYVIKGENGSGKSTFLLSLLGEIPLGTGSISIDGRELSGLSEQERSDTYSWYEEQEIAFNFTATDVLGWGGWSVGIADELRAEDLLDRQWRKLSRGERTRILLTSVLAGESAHVLLDEPAAGLDDAMVAHLASKLASKASAGATIIISEHDTRLMSALHAHELTIREGRLTE
jgi:iron complex transport system ATP-binding protein